MFVEDQFEKQGSRGEEEEGEELVGRLHEALQRLQQSLRLWAHGGTVLLRFGWFLVDLRLREGDLWINPRSFVGKIGRCDYLCSSVW